TGRPAQGGSPILEGGGSSRPQISGQGSGPPSGSGKNREKIHHFTFRSGAGLGGGGASGPRQGKACARPLAEIAGGSKHGLPRTQGNGPGIEAGGNSGPLLGGWSLD